MPQPAGYSGTPLLKKLGIKPGMKVLARAAPDSYWDLLGKIPAGVVVQTRLRPGVDFIHLFVKDAAALADELPRCLNAIQPDGIIWVSWPKKASKVPTDMTEDVVRQVALPLGLVDIKVCAVDEVWSGLKLMIRKELRKSK